MSVYIVALLLEFICNLTSVFGIKLYKYKNLSELNTRGRFKIIHFKTRV